MTTTSGQEAPNPPPPNDADAAVDAPKRSESDVYDRQIRLWGAESQEKMSKAKVLYIHVTGVSSEVLKNLVLAGIRAVICDNRPYPQAVADTPCFLLSMGKGDEGSSLDDSEGRGDAHPPSKKPKLTAVAKTVAEAVRPAVEELNPLLGSCEITDKSVSELDENLLKQFSIVVASNIGISDAIRLSETVTASGGKFYMADCFGMDGGCVLDLGSQHTYRPEQGKKLLDLTPLEKHVSLKQLFSVPLSDAVNRLHKTPIPVWLRYRVLLEYVERRKGGSWPDSSSPSPLDDFVAFIRQWVQESAPAVQEHDALTEEALRHLAKVVSVNSQVAPVCAVMGGMIGNEVIKAISGKGEPANNTLLFDGRSCKAWTFLVQSKETQ